MRGDDVGEPVPVEIGDHQAVAVIAERIPDRRRELAASPTEAHVKGVGEVLYHDQVRDAVARSAPRPTAESNRLSALYRNDDEDCHFPNASWPYLLTRPNQMDNLST